MLDLRELLEAELPGRYQLESELGSGGMATVFLAFDAALGCCITWPHT